MPPFTSTAPALSVYLPGLRPSLKEAKNAPSAPTGTLIVCSVQPASFPSSATALAATETLTVFFAPALRDGEAARVAPDEAEERRAAVRRPSGTTACTATGKSWRGCLKSARAAVSLGSRSASFTSRPSLPIR